MEKLTKHWKNLSLNDEEGSSMKLLEDKSTKEFILAAKFLTRRALSVETLVRTSVLYGDR